MPVEMNKSSDVKLTPVQEIKLTKTATELQIGQILRAQVISALHDNQVIIRLNGHNLNAKSAHHFSPGELLDVKVVANQSETILEVQHQTLGISTLQSALLEALPKQAPPTQLIQAMSQLMKSPLLSGSVYQQMNQMLNGIIPLAQLPQRLAQAINQSGIFFESTLLAWQRGMTQQGIKNDFKGQCIKLLNSLSLGPEEKISLPIDMEERPMNQTPLPLPGAIPQPLYKDPLLSLLEQSSESIQRLLHNQVDQVLARITAHQINNLSHDSKEGYLIMLDLPIKTPQGIDVIPLMIKQHKAEPMQQSKWSISFALSLDKLGDMQGCVGINANTIDIKFNVQKTATLNTLNEYQEEMRSVLSRLGLKLRDWKLQLGLEKNQIDSVNLHLLDIRV